MNNQMNEIITGRRLAFGPRDRLMNMSKTKYTWTNDIYETQENNTWFPKSIAMGDDRVQFRSKDGLTDRERNAYLKALAFASNLDGIQFNNLISNIGQHVTDPGVSLCLARQASEEGVHVRAYQTMIEAVADDPTEVYMMFTSDALLAKKNSLIMQNSDVLSEDPTPANFARAIVANILLEGVFFYSAFLTFFVLAKHGKMIASADQIRYIQRDEGGTHLELFAHMHESYKQENPHLYDAKFYQDAEQLFRDAVELEVEWGKHIIDGGFLGMTDAVVENYVKHLANERAKLIGLPKLYNVSNPVPWVDDFQKINGSKDNFFERKPTDYKVGGSLDW